MIRRGTGPPRPRDRTRDTTRSSHRTPPVSLRPSLPYGIETVVPELRGSSAAAGGLRNRVRYRFDNLLSRGTWAVLLWLGAVTLLAVLVSSGLLAVFRVDLAELCLEDLDLLAQLVKAFQAELDRQRIIDR